MEHFTVRKQLLYMYLNSLLKHISDSLIKQYFNNYLDYMGPCKKFFFQEGASNLETIKMFTKTGSLELDVL